MSRKLLLVGLGNYSLPGTRHNAGMMALNYLGALLHQQQQRTRSEAPAPAAWAYQRSCEGYLYEWCGRTGCWPENMRVFGFEETLRDMTARVERQAAESAQRALLLDPDAATTIYLFKPKTFMNFSGNAVRRAMRFLQVTPDELVIVHDELDLPLGRARWLRGLEKTNGHNGLRSVAAAVGRVPPSVGGVGGPWRLRVGIGRPAPVAVASATKSRARTSTVPIEKWVLGRFGPAASELLEQRVFPLVTMELLQRALGVKMLERVNFETAQKLGATDIPSPPEQSGGHPP